MSREYRVLSKLHAAYPPAPEVLLYCDDESILGAPFYLMEPVHGIIIRRDPPAAMNFAADTARRLSEAFVANLAELHRLDYGAIGLGGIGNPDGYLERQVKGWTERYHGLERTNMRTWRRLTAWMKVHRPASGAPAPDSTTTTSSTTRSSIRASRRRSSVSGLGNVYGGRSVDGSGTFLAYWIEDSDPAELKAVRWGPTNFPGSLKRKEIVELYARLTGRDTSAIGLLFWCSRD